MQYKELKSLLEADPKKAVEVIQNATIDRDIIDKLILEYDSPSEEFGKGRKVRLNQVGNIQKDKLLKNGKRVRSVKIPLSFQNYIVEFSTAFEVGEPVSINSSEDNKISEGIDNLWIENRINSIIIEAVEERKSKLQSAILFNIRNLDPNRSFQKSSGLNPKKDIKAKVLKNKDGQMTPIFDSNGNMIFFCWSFVIKEDDKFVQYIWIYDNSSVTILKGNKDGYNYISEKPHGFDCIPVVYTSQPQVEWKKSESLIDRYEVSLSKLGAANDYAGHPIMKFYGRVEGAPDKDEDGKAFRLEQKITDEGKVVTSDVEFLTYSNAPESVKLELEELKKLLFLFSSTVDLSFEALKGLGSTSGFAIQLMFLAPIINAKSTNTKINSPMIERIINILLSGICTTLKTEWKYEAQNTKFSVTFNSILPSDLKERVETLSKAVVSKIMSNEKAVTELGVAEDIKDELIKIENGITNDIDEQHEE